MIRRPPRSTLFPTRRSSDLRRIIVGTPLQQPARQCQCRRPGDIGIAERSEEHTSELQSQSNLVCRLLLEKKKKNNNNNKEKKTKKKKLTMIQVMVADIHTIN